MKFSPFRPGLPATSLCLALTLLLGGASAGYAEAPGEGRAEQAPAFDPQAAWDEFEDLLRMRYAYVERDDLDVEAQLARSRGLAVQTTSPEAFRRLAEQTALTFMDPHLIVGPLVDDDFAVVMSQADMDVAFRDGALKVVDVRRGTPAFEVGIRPGDEVLQIDGLAPDAAALLPFGPVLPEPSAAQLDYGALLAVNGRRKLPRTLQLRDATGAVRSVALPSGRETYEAASNDRLVTVERVGKDGKVVLLRPENSLGDNETITEFDRALSENMDAKAVILDMRGTPSGGNTEVGRSIIGHFTSAVRPYQMHRIPALEREFTVPRQFVEYVYPRAPHFSGPVIVLHGRWTGSMGEGIVIGMDAAGDSVTTVGSNMGDLLGGLWNFDLENSPLRVDLGGEALFHVDGTPREDYVADHPVTPADTASDGSDPALAAALSILEAEER